jgi:hypothetical protein
MLVLLTFRIATLSEDEKENARSGPMIFMMPAQPMVAIHPGSQPKTAGIRGSLGHGDVH